MPHSYIHAIVFDPKFLGTTISKKREKRILNRESKTKLFGANTMNIITAYVNNIPKKIKRIR